MSNKGFGTRAIHVGSDPDPATGAVIPPISLSTTFKQSSVGVHKGYEYSRSGNPNRDALENCMAALEGAKYGIAYSSGLAATSNVIAMFPAGTHVVSVNDVYGGTNRLLSKVAIKNNITASFVDLADPTNIKTVMKPETKIVWIETPTNPTLRLVDIKAITDIVHKEYPGVIVLVDNTFLSPYFQNPLSLGADLVLHSMTKFCNGHSDVVMGMILTSHEKVYEDLRFLQNSLGAIPSPFDCFLAHRGLKTLHLRMEQHAKNALQVAKFLEASPKVEKVIYPGLASHPQHELAKKQMHGFGGMITFYIKGGLTEANKFLQNVKLFCLAESLGGVESLAELPSIMTHASVSPESREALGISDNMIRLSVGIEDTDDLVEDVRQAVDSAVA